MFEALSAPAEIHFAGISHIRRGGGVDDIVEILDTNCRCMVVSPHNRSTLLSSMMPQMKNDNVRIVERHM